ncbi:SDR family NAD(P)-dependent oxidoreductase [Pirellulales bacterium]|nr:SDR family NAD(P)-dependent oxidoreductase [Pirellulales bacterium]
MNHNRLTGKVAWISGGTSGIGEATARLFAVEGASVAVVGRREPLCQAIAGEIEAADGRAIAAPCDVADGQQVRDSIERTVEAFGRLDIVVNNAGMVDIRQLHEYDDAQFDGVMAVNLKSMFYAFKHAYAHLRKQPRSYVVNVGSISSFVGQASTPVYTTTKHAVLGLSRSIALDYAADGVRSNCVCPGITDTPMLREHIGTDEALRQRLRRVPLSVALQPEDVARTILYLSCEDSAGVTGTSVVVDCGYLAAAEWDTADNSVIAGDDT